jgi:16S rRNA (cytidine1402-2'-O)-methyltransferase
MALGKLTLVGTPIGNLGDISPRAREALAGATTLAAEDTRRARNLLAALGLGAHKNGPRLVSYYKDNERGRVPQLVREMQAGERVTLISDSGLPGIADPGAALVAAARAAGLPVEVIPGPCAAALAVAGSGFAGPFLFAGFLPRKGKERRALLARLQASPETIVIYESPFRIKATVADLLAAWGNRPATLARELTKLHEEWLGPDLAAITAALAARAGVKGECVLVVAGAAAA